MKVMVTGATGFIGSHSVRALLAAGHRVRALVRDPDKVEHIFGESLTAKIELCRGDITDAPSIAAALEDCDAVLHAAAVVSLDPKYATQAYRTNTQGARHVLQGALDAGIEHIVYVSSLTAILDPEGGDVHVDGDVRVGGEGYAESKAESENYVRSLQAAGAPIHTTYPAGVIGPEDPGRSAAMMGVKMLIDGMLMITSGGIQQIDVRDLARIHVKLLEDVPGPGRHIVAGHYLPWAELAATFEQIDGLKLRTLRMPGSVLRAMGSLGDALASVSSFRPPLSREAMTYMTQWKPVQNSPQLEGWGVALRPPLETLRDTVGWLRENGYIKR